MASRASSSHPSSPPPLPPPSPPSASSSKTSDKLNSSSSSTSIDDSAAITPADFDEPDNVFLFIPNIIGYFRIVFALISLYYMPTNHVKGSIFYLISSLLDAFDGYAARHFNQSTRFGSILDQLTDRLATLGLVMVLCVLYPDHLIWFQLSAMLDIASHWMYVWATCLQGRTSHKFIDPASNPILRIYYTSRPVLFFMCACNELFFCALYLRYFTTGPVAPIIEMGLFDLIIYSTAPFMALKALISLIHLFVASLNVATIDTNERLDQKNK